MDRHFGSPLLARSDLPREASGPFDSADIDRNSLLTSADVRDLSFDFNSIAHSELFQVTIQRIERAVIGPHCWAFDSFACEDPFNDQSSFRCTHVLGFRFPAAATV